MAIDELLRANLETHWYAVNQYDELEIVEKDDKFTRCYRRVLGLVTCSDSYAHIRYNQIVMTLVSAVRNEWNRETVGKYLQLIERIKEKVGSTLPPNEEEKRIVARYNQLGFSKAPATGEQDIERMESFVQQQLAQDAKPLHSLSNYIVFSLEDGSVLKISKEGSKLQASDEALHRYVRDLEKAKAVCKEQKLDHLVFPDAMIVKIYLAGKIRDLLIERNFDEDLEGYHRFFDDQNRCDEIVRQLAILTLNTGANVAYWDLCPLRSTRKGPVGIRDLKMGSVYNGLFGGKKTENGSSAGLENLFNRGNSARKRNRAIIFKEIERKLGISLSEDAHALCADSSPSQIPRYMEIANNLRQFIAIKKKLDELPVNQSEKSTFYVDMEREVALRGLEILHYPELRWDMSPPTNEQLMERVVEELKRFEVITGVSSCDVEGWTLQLFGPSVEKHEMVTGEEVHERDGIGKIIRNAVCDIFLSVLNIASPVQEVDF